VGSGTDAALDRRRPTDGAERLPRPVVDAEGNERKLVANLVQFDETPPSVGRGPQLAEHTDDILRELGKGDDEIVQLKHDGACA
jgi:crotonobetainyl-CoA:carnitine CoA-transferase CaiB-like acyl-CoA transferase